MRVAWVSSSRTTQVTTTTPPHPTGDVERAIARMAIALDDRAF